MIPKWRGIYREASHPTRALKGLGSNPTLSESIVINSSVSVLFFKVHLIFNFRKNRCVKHPQSSRWPGQQIAQNICLIYNLATTPKKLSLGVY